MLWEGAYGIIYLLNPKNYIDARILRDGIYEHKLVTYFCNQFNSLGCDIFLDIGANIGNHSCALAKYFDEVYSFEPFNLHFSLLKINTSNLRNINIFNYACGNQNSKKSVVGRWSNKF